MKKKIDFNLNNPKFIMDSLPLAGSSIGSNSLLIISSNLQISSSGSLTFFLSKYRFQIRL